MLPSEDRKTLREIGVVLLSLQPPCLGVSGLHLENLPIWGPSAVWAKHMAETRWEDLCWCTDSQRDRACLGKSWCLENLSEATLYLVMAKKLKVGTRSQDEIRSQVHISRVPLPPKKPPLPQFQNFLTICSFPFALVCVLLL